MTIAYTKVPEHLYEPFLGKRMNFSIDVTVDKHGLQRKEMCLNPWIETLDDYFGCLDRGDLQGAKAHLKDPELLPRLRKCSSWITREEGDINFGTGVVEMDGKRIEFRRGRSGEWVISDVLQR